MTTIYYTSHITNHLPRAAKIRSKGIHQFHALFKDVDVIVLPTTGNLNYKIHKDAERYGVSDMEQSGQAMKFMCMLV